MRLTYPGDGAGAGEGDGDGDSCAVDAERETRITSKTMLFGDILSGGR